MKIDQKVPGEKVKLMAKRVYELREIKVSYPEIKKIFPYHRSYLHALCNYGRELFKDENEVNPSYPPVEENI
jgi:RNA processing factor Prp31